MSPTVVHATTCQATLTKILPRTADVTSLRLEWDEAGTPFDFLAGQWVRVVFALPSGERSGNHTIASPPSCTSGIDLCLQVRAGSALALQFQGEFKLGSSVAVSGPYGTFHLPDPLDHDPVLVTEAVGASAVRSIVLDLLERGTDRTIDLVLGAKEQADLLFADEFASLAERHSNFRFVPCLTEPPDGWNGRTGEPAHVTVELARGSDTSKFWICGTERTVRRVSDHLAGTGIAAERIEVERFD